MADAPLDNIDNEDVHIDQDEFVDGLLPEPQWEGTVEYPDLEEIEIPRGAEITEDEDGTQRPTPSISGKQSLFNDYYLFKYKGSQADSYPFLEEQQPNHSDLYTKTKLVDLVKNPLGNRIYKPSDFLYLRDIGSPINRMVTLRRFPFAVMDDITNTAVVKDRDVARLVTFMSDDVNQLSNLMNMSWGLRYRQLAAANESGSMIGDQNGIDGYMGSIMAYIDPKFGQEAMRGSNSLNYDPTHDQNRVHGPVDAITDTHIREIGLDFTFDINLEFHYKMESLNGINGKAAFIDLISNVLACTMNNGKFWGGARYWVGPRPTKYMKNLQFLSARDFDDFLNKGFVQLKGILGKFTGADAGKNAVDLLKTIAFNALNLNFGRLLDQIGRPGIPVMNSLLTNAPLGEWHLTIGNPFNPILMAGNLILIDTQITTGNSLGYDDFPDEIIVRCQLKPAMPRDKAGIESMFNLGKGRTYFKPSDSALSRRRSDGSSISSNNRGKRSLIYNELIERPLDTLISGRYDAAAARDALKDVIYDFRQIKK